MGERKKLLIALTSERNKYKELSKYSQIYWIEDLDDKKLDKLLPSIDAILVHPWHDRLNQSRLAKMNKLRIIQCEIGSVNMIPVKNLSEKVILCNNTSAYSTEVAEHAFALLLACAKRIIRFDNEIKRKEQMKFSRERAKDVVTLSGRSLGILGYGGIGKKAASLANAFGMKIHVYTRRKGLKESGVQFHRGRRGLNLMLRVCDAVLLSLPLTNLTRNILSANELNSMKSNAILINVGRAELVNAQSLYEHLIRNSQFSFATDVWWPNEGNGKETFQPRLPFLSLDNFIGTPHIAGPSAFISGTAIKPAVDNLVRYFSGKKLQNVIDKTEYV